jgi:homoserine kinase type II
MAVFTALMESDLRQIVDAYQLGELTSAIGIADGDTETTFLFRSGRGEFIVTLFESGADPLDLERAFHTMERLAEAGIPCPTPCRTESGAATTIVSGKLVAVVSFVPGSLMDIVTAEKCYALGIVAAQIHVALQKPSRMNRDDLPRGAVHGALNRDNVFFIGNAVSGVINFRLVHDEILLSEIAFMLARWAFDDAGRLVDGLAEALLAGYESVRVLSEKERTALPAFVMAAAAMLYAERGDLYDLESRADATLASAKALLERALTA